jgi:uncharacterized protein YjdB
MENLWPFIVENLLEALMNVASLASSLVSLVVNIKTKNEKKYIKIILVISVVIYIASTASLITQFINQMSDSGPTTEVIGDTTAQNEPVDEDDTTTTPHIETITDEDKSITDNTTTSKIPTITTVPTTITTTKVPTTTTTKPAASLESDIKNDGGNVIVGSGTINDPDVSVSGNQNTVVINPQTTTETKIAVSKVTISDKSVTLKVGETKKLKATVIYSDNSKDENVIWTSSNENVATVDENGNVIAVSSGIAEIIAHASKNNTTMQEVCSVKVSAPPSGYQIRLSSETIPMASNFKVYITPYDVDVDKIMIYGKSPSGKIYELEYQNKGYEIYEEPGEWTIYAKIKNNAGEYVASKPEEFVTLQVEPIDIDSILNGMIKT